MTYIPTIGLEIHAELKTQSKMFCSCPNDPTEQKPNVNICPICMGHPGTLPVANEDAIGKVLQVGLALGCTASEQSKFDRKNYFYPDLPKGYQISQYDMPFCAKGNLEIEGENIRVTRVHLEEDTGRLLHPEGADYSLIDFNRAGVPLMELVTEPDIHTAQQARLFAEQLQLLLRYLQVSDADMEKGQMRVEANVSVRPEGTEKLGTKVEVKNLNSFRSVESAIDYEIQRQTEALEAGNRIVQETRGWNQATQKTFSQREKEEANDYRYFPEPDLPPLQFTKETVTKLQKELPELPQARHKRFVQDYKLSPKEAAIFVQQKEVGDYFEKAANLLQTDRQKKLAANYILSDLLGLLAGASIKTEAFLIKPEDFASLIEAIENGKISSPAAKAVLKEMFATGKTPHEIIEKQGLAQTADIKHIEEVAKTILEKNPKAVEDFKKGKENSLQFLVGQMMAASKGTVSPGLAKQILHTLLTNS